MKELFLVLELWFWPERNFYEYREFVDLQNYKQEITRKKTAAFETLEECESYLTDRFNYHEISSFEPKKGRNFLFLP